MSVLAHGVGQSQDLPLPLDLVLQAGAATVVVSFLIVAIWWKKPRLAAPPPDSPSSTAASETAALGTAPVAAAPGTPPSTAAPGIPPSTAEHGTPASTAAPGKVSSAGASRPERARWCRLPVRVLLLGLTAYLVGNAFLGPRGPENPAAHALFVWLWVGLVPLSLVAGPVWREINPLRTLFWLLRLPAGGLRPVPADRSWGRWPAAVALLAFVWFELVAPHRSDPLVVGGWLLGYALVQLAGATLRGEEWFARGDCFEVYSDLAGRLSPVRWRNPLAGVARTPLGPGLAAFLAVWWGSTIADSASGSPAWAAFVQMLGGAVLPGTVGLVLLCAVVLVSVHRLSGGMDVTASLIPIAVAYTLAHYLSLLIVEGPRGVLLLVQQWGLAEGASWDVVPLPGVVAGAQIALILIGHVLGVVVAHDLALTAAPQRPVLATLAEELPVVLLMIGYTWAGLFLLFVR